IIEADGVEKLSMHYEADLDRSGRSVLDVRPLYWKDGWPVAGSNIQKETPFKIDGAGMKIGGEAVSEITITPAANVGGYLGMPYMKITVSGGRALALSGNSVVAQPASDAAEQLWRVD